ncbi:MAG: hypothetical protein LBN08_02460 [Lactobacillales bacterium]|jgi:hypothetical protein|nr:hypothetical protein [Lactobacillales bacterium]
MSNYNNRNAGCAGCILGPIIAIFSCPLGLIYFLLRRVGGSGDGKGCAGCILAPIIAIFNIPVALFYLIFRRT